MGQTKNGDGGGDGRRGGRFRDAVGGYLYFKRFWLNRRGWRVLRKSKSETMSVLCGTGIF